jgi:hypothetical protein
MAADGAPRRWWCRPIFGLSSCEMSDLNVIYEAMWCPACGFQLDFKPWEETSASFEICPSCGIQFGYDDAGPDDRRTYYDQWRHNWQAGGSKWWSKRPCPSNFDASRQIERLGSLE